MIFEVISSSIVGGVFLAAKLKRKGEEENDHEKIIKIADNVGLKKDDKGLRLHRKSRPKGKHYTEYVYQIPLGFDFDKDILTKKGAFEDGLNNKKTSYFISLSDLKKVNFTELKKIDSLRNLPEQFKRIFGEKQLIRKTVDMSFDGMLRIKVYDRDIPKYIDFAPHLWEKCEGWNIPIGEDREGVIIHEADDSHVMLAGTTKYGKTQFLLLFITSLIHQQPEHTKLTLIDLKGGLSFAEFENLKQTVTLADDVKSARKALESAVNDLEKRFRYFRSKGIKNVKQGKIKDRHFIIIDEVGELIPKQATGEDKEEKAENKRDLEACQAYITTLVRRGASLGFLVVQATQYPTGEIVNNQVKANSTTKICYRLDTATQSTTVLDETGAEKISLRGRCYYRTPDGTKQIQTYLIDDDTIKEVIAPHIVIKPREENQENAENYSEGTKNGQHTFFFEETDLP